jgi:phage I-like protein
MLIARHTVLLTGGAPEWVHLVPAGTFKGADGRGPYRLADAQGVIQASMAAGKLVLDENHSTDVAAVAGQPAPARAWIVEMQARDDGIWGRVEWTEAGSALMADKAYRAISPVFRHQKDGTITQLLRAALTNDPNLTQLQSLHTREHEMDPAKLRQLLGLPDTADEAAILAAVTANKDAVSAHATQLASIATAAGLDAKLAPDALATALQTARAGAGDVARMATTIAGLEGQIATMRAETSLHAAKTYVDAQIKLGKPINALRDHYIARHQVDPAAVEKEIAGLPVINAGGVSLNAAGGGGGAPDADGLDDMDKTVAHKMGLDPAKFAKTKKASAPFGATDGRAA